MDNNKPNPTPIPAGVPTPPPQSSSKMVWLIGGLVIILIIVAGIYVFLGRQKTQNATIPQPTSSSAPTTENLDQELNSINVQAADSDFTSIDEDLKTL